MRLLPALVVLAGVGCTATPTPSVPDASSADPRPAAAPPSAKPTLPIEVLGPRGTQVSVSLALPEVAGITHLALRCHGCGYGDSALDADDGRTKAALSINGGPAIALAHYTGDGRTHGNADLEVRAPERFYGSIGGGFHTVRFRLPLPDATLRPGLNTFTFVHAAPDDRSLGFRVIGFDLLRGDATALPGDTFAVDDPARWTPPLEDPADIARGEALWAQRDLLSDPYHDALDGQRGGGPVGARIKASCADCHASKGEDLKYFNFSNRAIAARAQFHGLSARDGERIASYIRVQPTPSPAGARPWNPPYQPGPGLDARPVAEWAAGAGIDAVLDDDTQMQPYLFPQGIEADAVARVVDRFGTLNMRELPIAIQLPDWNAWLPRVHPLDAFDAADPNVRSDFAQKPTDQPYFEVLYATARSNPSSASVDAMRGNLERWLERGASCYSQSLAGGPATRALDGAVLREGLAFPNAPVLALGTEATCEANRSDVASTWAIEAAKAGLIAWLSVKQWELIHPALETASQDLGKGVCSGTPARCGDYGEARGWGVRGFSVFFRAAHYVGFDGLRFRDQDPLVSTFGNTAWYHLQLVLNPGYREAQPSHFPYTLIWMHNLASAAQQPESFRFWATFIKMRQLQTNGAYGPENGLSLRTAQPFWLYSDEDGQSFSRSAVGPVLWKRLVEASLRELIADADNATALDWQNADQNDVVQERTSQDIGPCVGTKNDPDCFKDGNVNPFVAPGRYQGRNTYRVIPRLRAEVGVSEEVLDLLIGWSKRMWTHPDVQAKWDALKAP